jgi:type IV pilus assembly protein PilA
VGRGKAERVKRAKRIRKSQAFTLIELLIVVLVLAILMAVALPLYLGAVANAQVGVCRSNMQTIANGEQAFKVRDPAHQYTTDLALLPIDLGATPACPEAGTYSVVISDGTNTGNNGRSVPVGGLIVTCTASGHGVFAPGVDSQ